MNWRGLWTNTTQFYQNDVVLSPITTAPYILTRLALRGGADPSAAPADWAELAPATGGITGLVAGQGISITGTPTIPQINNTGILQVVAGTGITNVGTATDPELRNTGLIQLNVGTGLASTGGQTPTLTNTGVLSITTTPGSGISVTGSPSAPTLTNTGILGLVGGTGLTVSPVPSAQFPTLLNTGVLQVLAGTGIAVTGPATTPTISMTTTSADPTATFLSAATAGTIPAATTATIPVVLSGTSTLAQHLLTGSPDPNGTWILDVGSYVFENAAPAGGTNTIVLGIEDVTTGGGPYTYLGVPGTGTVNVSGINPPYFVSLNKLYIDVAAARATGLRVFDNLLISNDTGGDLNNTGWSGIPATYYPNGIQ